MRRLVAFWAALPLLMGQGSKPSLHAVTAVHHTTLSGLTRVTIDVSGAFEFKWDRLHEPERVYYDIAGAEPRFGSQRTYTEEPVDNLVERIRVAETAPGVTRVVLTLTGPMQLSPSKQTAPDRLVVEIRPAPAASTSSAANGGAVSPKPAAPPVEVPKAATRTSSGESSLTRALGLKIARVVIDPGHGGHDEGTAGPHGLLEKNLVLDVATRLGALIRDRMESEVLFTRSDDTFIPLGERTAMANDQKADLFLSIHANSSSEPGVAGIESFYLDVKGTRYSMDIAARENASYEKSVFDLSDLVQQIAKQDKAAESREFASCVQDALYAFSSKNIPGAKDRGVKPAPFVVLIGAHMPSVLTEIGFLSNPKEEALLTKPDYRQKLAEAIYRGVEKYADSLSHFQTEPSPVAKNSAAATSHNPR